MKKMIQMLSLAVMGLALIACDGCGDTPYKRVARGQRAVNMSARLAEDFDTALKSYLVGAHNSCKDKHGVKTAGFDKCLLPALRIVRTWTGEKNGVKTGKGVLPTIQSAQKATRLSLDAAYDYIKSHEETCKQKDPPKKCVGDWQTLLKKAVCPLVAIVDRGIKLGAYKAASNSTYKTVVAFIKVAGGCK